MGGLAMGDPIRSTGPCTREPLPEDLQLPFGVPHRERDRTEGARRSATTLGREAVSAGAAVLAHATGAGAFRMAASVLGPLGWVQTASELAAEMAKLPVDSDVQAFLRAACGDTGGAPASNRQEVVRLETAAATAAVLFGMGEPEVARLRERLAAGSTFDRQLALIREQREAKPGAFAAAAAEYRGLLGRWQAGVAAGIEGWDADRGAVFEAGRRAAVAWLEGQPPEAQRRVRQRAQRAKQEALVDVARDRVHQGRVAQEPHYRSGVHHARQLREAHGAAALASAVERAQAWLAVNDPAARGGAAPHCPAGHRQP